MICAVKFDYWQYAPKYRENAAKKMDKFLNVQRIGSISELPEEELKAWYDKTYHFDIVELSNWGLSFSTPEIVEAGADSFHAKVAVALSMIHRRLDQNGVGAPIQLHVEGRSDSYLPAVDKVMVLEDACTDKLQEHLEEGWRIIAVCPQRDQRRPDYILGKAPPPPIITHEIPMARFTNHIKEATNGSSQSEEIPF